jgi:oligosaccharide reducing-end xylanase
MNAVVALAATDATAGEFVDALWDTSIPSGQWRYYDGMLYTLALLHVSGNFRVYPPA